MKWYGGMVSLAAGRRAGLLSGEGAQYSSTAMRATDAPRIGPRTFYQILCYAVRSVVTTPRPPGMAASAAEAIDLMDPLHYPTPSDELAMPTIRSYGLREGDPAGLRCVRYHHPPPPPYSPMTPPRHDPELSATPTEPRGTGPRATARATLCGG